MREPNHDDARLALRLYDLRREREMRKARRMIARKVFNAPFEEIEKRLDYEDPHNEHWRQVTSYWDLAASFVQRGIFHPDVYLDSCGEGVFLYAMLKPHLAAIRARTSPRFLRYTEAVVEGHEACRERVAALEAMFRTVALEEVKKGRRKRDRQRARKGAGAKGSGRLPKAKGGKKGKRPPRARKPKQAESEPASVPAASPPAPARVALEPATQGV